MANEPKTVPAHETSPPDAQRPAWAIDLGLGLVVGTEPLLVHQEAAPAAPTVAQIRLPEAAAQAGPAWTRANGYRPAPHDPAPAGRRAKAKAARRARAKQRGR